MMLKLLDQESVSRSLDLWEGFPNTAIRVKEGEKRGREQKRDRGRRHDVQADGDNFERAALGI